MSDNWERACNPSTHHQSPITQHSPPESVTPHPTPIRLGIVADDLTGAVDTGVQLARWGLHTLVILEEGPIPDAAVVVLTTDSRDEPADEAYRRASLAASRIAGRLPYKKMDSTLRGNLGPELDGLLDGLKMRRALVAPAFPAAGRTTVGGIHMINGVPLAESPFACDPIWPATESHVPSLLARQTRRTVGPMPLKTVEQGPDAVASALKTEPAEIVVADATETRHLRTLACALGRLEELWLPCGCAGFAEELPAALGLEKTTPFHWPPSPAAVLVVAGSRNLATGRQLRRAAEGGALRILEVDPAGGQNQEVDILADALRLLSTGAGVAITTCFSRYRKEQGTRIAGRLARIATRILRAPLEIAGVVLTGGDTARAVCRETGTTALKALGEVQAGVAMATLVGGDLHGLRVVTKAGGFGDDQAILQSIACLRGEET